MTPDKYEVRTLLNGVEGVARCGNRERLGNIEFAHYCHLAQKDGTRLTGATVSLYVDGLRQRYYDGSVGRS